MRVNNIKTILYLVLYVVILCTIFIVDCHIIDINPITATAPEPWIDIRVYPFKRQILMYIGMFFAISILCTLIKQVCLVETKVLYVIIVSVLWVYTILCYTFAREIKMALLGTAVLVLLKLMMSHIRRSYPTGSLLNQFKKYNAVVVILVLVINVIYIVVPKNEIYVYKLVDASTDVEYEIQNDKIEVISNVEIVIVDDNVCASGVLVKAKQQGISGVRIYELVKSMNYLKDNKVLNVTIDSNLNFDNYLDLEYVKFFYPLNLCIIVICLFYMMAIPCYKIYGEIRNRKTLPEKNDD